MIEEYYRIIVDCWKFMRRIMQARTDTDDYWQWVHGEALKISARHPGRFCEKLILLVIEETEEVLQNGKQQKDAG